MRRSMLVAVIILSVACAGGRSASPPEDVLFLRSGSGITLVRDLPGGTAVRFPRGVPSVDLSAVVRAVAHGGDTRVLAVDAGTGADLWSTTVPGRLEVKVVSDHGRLVALGDRRGSAGYPPGRSVTTLVIVGSEGVERRLELQGNYEPEAFSTDGTSLFVVEYLPPERPDRYRVRRLDLGTEQVVGVYTVDQHLQKAMRGTARIQAASRDGRRLYTLYTLLEPGGEMRAFVHVLALDELWAHCVDLPASFARAVETQVALSLSLDESRLYVTDVGGGKVAEIDTQTLGVVRTASVDLDGGRGPAHSATGAEELYLARGTALVSLQRGTLELGRSWDLGARITGLQTAVDGRRVYVGLRDEVTVLDAVSGDLLGPLEALDVGRIDHLGPSTRFLDLDRTGLKCAC